MDALFSMQAIEVIKRAAPVTEELHLDWDMHTFRTSTQPQNITRRTLVGWDFGNYIHELAYRGNANAIALLLLICLNVQKDGWSYFTPDELPLLSGLTAKKVEATLAFLCKKRLSCSEKPVLRAVRFVHAERPPYTAYTAYPHATPQPSLLLPGYRMQE